MGKTVTLSEFSCFFSSRLIYRPHVARATRKENSSTFYETLRGFAVDLMIVFLIPYHGTKQIVLSTHDEGQILFPVGLATWRVTSAGQYSQL